MASSASSVKCPILKIRRRRSISSWPQAKIPESVREALIILVPLPKPEGDLIFRAKVQDLAAFKGGDRLFINLSDSQIRVRLGDTKVTVAPETGEYLRGAESGQTDQHAYHV